MPGRHFHSSSLNYAGRKVSDITKPQRHVRTVLGNHVRGTCRRVAGARLGGIAQRVARRAAHLRRRREAALVRTARAALRVADRAAHELARRRVAAVRRGAHAGIAILARLDDAIAAHLQRDGLARRIGLHEAAGVELATALRARHDRACRS